MNTILTILLLIALIINIVCDIVRLCVFLRTVEESKQNVKNTVWNAMVTSYYDWTHDDDNTLDFEEYFKENFDKYL